MDGLPEQPMIKTWIGNRRLATRTTFGSTVHPWASRHIGPALESAGPMLYPGECLLPAYTLCARDFERELLAIG